MIEIRSDPANAERLVLTATVVLFLEKALLQSLDKELQDIISEQAKADFRKPAVLKELRRLTTEHLAKLLGIG
jgi:hypothetical protein